MLLPMLYVLDGYIPVPEPDRHVWGDWFVAANRSVGHAQLAPSTVVTTQFLGLAHGVAHDHTPLLFETTVTWAGRRCPSRLYTGTWAEAEDMQTRIVAWARRRISDCEAVAHG